MASAAAAASSTLGAASVEEATAAAEASAPATDTGDVDADPHDGVEKQLDADSSKKRIGKLLKKTSAMVCHPSFRPTDF